MEDKRRGDLESLQNKVRELSEMHQALLVLGEVDAAYSKLAEIEKTKEQLKEIERQKAKGNEFPDLYPQIFGIEGLLLNLPMSALRRVGSGGSAGKRKSCAGNKILSRSKNWRIGSPYPSTSQRETSTRKRVVRITDN